MAQVTRKEDADRSSSPDEDTTVTHVGDGPEGVAGPAAVDLPPGASRAVERQEKRAARTTGFFTIYKKGQGYWTRMGTLVGAALIGTLVTWEIYAQIPRFFIDTQRGRTVALISAAVFAVVYAFFVWRLMNKPAHVDFLIATDSEMKKVNWTSRRELIGSTKVVILFMFGIAIILFVLDLLFNSLFYFLRVLEVPWWKQVFGIE